jgi:hypothetical protein
MATRKSAPTTPRKSAPAKKAAPAKAGAKPSAGSARPSMGRPPVKKSGRSIVNQKRTPWGLIWTTVVIVVLAVLVIGYAVFHKPAKHLADSSGSALVNTSDPYSQPELPAAAAIKGVTYTIQPNHTHVEGHLTYSQSPPVGGNHSQYWADCTGTVYPKAIANENAVHMLEHGAVWITYAPSLPADQAATLAKQVTGVDRMAMSPYPGKMAGGPISLQAWGYQLFVPNASDPRIKQFITALKFNQKTTPENATCSQPSFKQHPSTYGHPLWVAAT